MSLIITPFQGEVLFWMFLSPQGFTSCQSVAVSIARLRLGNLGDYKSVGHGVLELRVDIGPRYRVYIGQDGPRLILLLYGGTKRTQAADIKKAQENWADYIEG